MHRHNPALAAAAIALLAWFQSWRSANAATKSASIAEANEERSKYGWTITLHPNGDHYVVRNVDTLAARDVKFTNEDEFARARFLVHDSDSPPCQRSTTTQPAAIPRRGSGAGDPPSPSSIRATPSRFI
jgi:hypothetical protein